MASLAAAGSAWAAELEADFHFNGTRAAPTGEALTDIGEGNAFAPEVVDNAPAARQVLAFPAGGGLSLGTTGLAGSRSYSVVVLFRLDSAAAGRRKLIDFSGGISDAGLYLCDGRLLIELQTASPCPLGEPVGNDWLQVALTRDGDTGEVRAHLGTDSPTAVDALDAFSLGSELRFFRDDDASLAAEHSAGAVARLRIYDGVLTEPEVAALDRLDGSAPQVSLAAVPATSSDATPTFSGTAGTEAGDLRQIAVKVYNGSSTAGEPVRTLTATPTGGSWSATSSPALPDGTYTARAEQSDGAGNTGRSQTRSFTVDTAAPAVTLAPPGGPTNDATPTYAGEAGDGPGDAGSVTVRVYAGSSASGTPVQSLVATREGTGWSVTGTAALPDGDYTARAEQADEAGNIGVSEVRQFSVDTVPAAVSLDKPDGGVTGDRTPAYGGAAGDASGDAVQVTIRVYDGTAASGTPAQVLTASRSGATWTTEGSPPLPDGTYTAQAEQRDAAGNVGLSQPRTFTVDGSGPEVSLELPADGTATNDNTPTFGGAAGDQPGDQQTITVKVYEGATVTGDLEQMLTATRAGGAWAIEGSPALPDGVYTAQAQQSDSAGNANVSEARTFTVDTVPPDTTITSSPPDATNDSTPEFGFSSQDAARFVCRLYPAGETSLPAFGDCVSPSAPGPLADGPYIFQVAGVDAAGNQDASPGSRTFQVDTTAPRTSIAVGPGDTTALDAAFVFTASEAASFRCRLDSGAWEPCSSPQSYSGLPLGPHTFEVAASDAAGNQGSAVQHAWQILLPGARIPAASLQAVTLAKELVALRRTLKRFPLRRAARRGTIRLTGIDSLTSGTLELKARARGGGFARARIEVPMAGSYEVPLKLTKRGRKVAGRVAKLEVDLTLSFTDSVGRSLRAHTRAIMRRSGLPRP